ncbi:hypothetical protein, partial [Bradyrhizobium sp.]|uniref:hypothetical protein n=1 Tax=Bradyrhizobium sp. TaxID=376 RepID=UPI003C43818A
SGEFDQGLQIDKAVLESISLLVPIPQFVKVGAAMEHELRKVGTSVDAVDPPPAYSLTGIVPA